MFFICNNFGAKVQLFFEKQDKKQKNSKPTSIFCNFATCVDLQSVYYTMPHQLQSSVSKIYSIRRAMSSNFQTKNQVHLYRHICSSPSIFSLINQVEKVGGASFSGCCQIIYPFRIPTYSSI